MSPDLTPEDEAILDAQEAEREVDDWLASWSDDFNSDEYLSGIHDAYEEWCDWNADRESDE